MVDHIVKLRNNAVSDAMAALAAEEDPNEEEPVLDAMAQLPKKEWIELLLVTLSVAVHTNRGSDKIVNVLLGPNERVALTVELTSESPQAIVVFRLGARRDTQAKREVIAE